MHVNVCKRFLFLHIHSHILMCIVLDLLEPLLQLEGHSPECSDDETMMGTACQSGSGRPTGSDQCPLAMRVDTMV